MLEDFNERVFERCSAGGIEQLQKAGGIAAHVFAAVGKAAQKYLADRHRFGESIEAAMLPGALLFCGQSLQVLGGLDLLTAVPGTLVCCNELVLLDDPNSLDVG